MNNSNLYIMNLIKLYLKAYKIAFNDKELCKVLVTDPDFPSLASVSATMMKNVRSYKVTHLKEQYRIGMLGLIASWKIVCK